MSPARDHATRPTKRNSTYESTRPEPHTCVQRCHKWSQHALAQGQMANRTTERRTHMYSRDPSLQKQHPQLNAQTRDRVYTTIAVTTARIKPNTGCRTPKWRHHGRHRGKPCKHAMQALKPDALKQRPAAKATCKHEHGMMKHPVFTTIVTQGVTRKYEHRRLEPCVVTTARPQKATCNSEAQTPHVGT